MLEKRKAIDARARQIVEESGVLWAVARDQAKAEHARARQIVGESGIPWASAIARSEAEMRAQAAQDSATLEQSGPVQDGTRPGAVIGGCFVALVVVVGGLGLLFASFVFSDNAGDLRDAYTDVARPGLVVAADTLGDLGLGVVAGEDLPTTAQLERDDSCDCYWVSLGKVSLAPIDGEYYQAVDAVGRAVSAAGYGTLRDADDLHTHQSIRFHGFPAWSLNLVATDVYWDGDHLEAQWLDVYATASILGAFETS